MVIRLTVATLIIGLTALQAARLRSGPGAVDILPALDRIPTGLHDWWSEEVPVSDVEIKVLDADVLLHRVYQRHDGAKVWLFIAYFAAQQVNSQIHSPRNCLPGGGLTVQSVKTKRIRFGETWKPATCMRIARNDFSGSVFYWFRTRGGTIAGEYALKWELVKNSLAGRPTDAAFVRVLTAEADLAAAQEFLALLDAPLNRIFGEVGL